MNNLKKIIAMLAAIFAVATVAVVVPALTETASATCPAGTKNIVYFTPHQDDETLTMGIGIKNDTALAAQCPNVHVHVVFVTKGNGTAAKQLMCDGSTGRGPLAASTWYGNNAVCSESYGGNPNRAVSETNITQWRNNEGVDAVEALGVDPAYIHFTGVNDSGTCQSCLMNTIAGYVNAYGTNTSLNTMSWFDSHWDHYNLGMALNKYCNQNNYGLCTFWHFGRYHGKVTIPGETQAAWNPAVLNGMAAYDNNDPSNGRYAIGREWSAWGSFNKVESTHQIGYYHSRDAGWTAAQKQTAANWLAVCNPVNGTDPFGPTCQNSGW
jgi:LmbE family N-acetylglucosaminyl deacetylase